MKINKFLLTLVMVCCMFALGVLTASAATYGDYTYTVSGGEVTITGFDKSVSGAITIPSEINGYPVTTIGEDAFYDCYRLESINIPDSVITIGEDAFCFCDNLESINIPDSVTTIGGGAFYSCDRLENVYYKGTEQQWGDISIGDGNESLTENVIFLGIGVKPTKTTISPDGKTFTVAVNEENVGKTVILALYKGDSLVDIGYKVYESEDLTFTTDKQYDTANVYLWNSLSGLKSVTNAEKVK